MRLICLNGWGGKLHEPLLAFLAEADPDVLCLQEVVHTPSTNRGWLTYRDGGTDLPQRANFFAEVSSALRGHVTTFCPAARGDLWDGGTRYPSFWGLATFVRETIPIIGQRQGFVHGAFSPHGYGEHPRSRSAHAVRLYDLEAERPVTIAHMHGLREPSGKHDTPARAAQAARLLELTRSVAEDGDPIVVCGDFNVLPASETFAVLRGFGLADLVTARGFTDTRTSYYTKAGRYADYMLVNDAVKVLSFDALAEPEVSDHRPLLLEFA
ncbi:MAG: endonuclease/exonuclease/phosphatase family protein [Mesorhizobium sp.]|nr:endonuclease/exonuclease/phosphatase family protein [Mesorhizobium sp.]